MHVGEHTIELDSSPVFYRSGEAATSSAPPAVFVHGVPSSCDDWIPFLERTGGLAPDLIGFGRSGKAGNLDYSLGGLAGFLERFLSELEVEPVRLVGHDWGAAAAVAFALRHPDRVERLAIVNAVPLLEGFRWHRFARLWRRPLLGELAMGSTTKRLLGRALRSGSVDPNAWPPGRIDALWGMFDQGTQRAILRLYRSADEDALAVAGSELPSLNVPTLVVWGERDPWLDASFGEAYASRLPRARLERIADAGHWPWLDQRTVVDLLVGYLEGDP